jgi:aspartate 1-decarboxylase
VGIVTIGRKRSEVREDHPWNVSEERRALLGTNYLKRGDLLKIVLGSKIHRAYVTSRDPDYIGSVFIDRDLMERAKLWEYERVLICNVDNGERWETYALPAARGSGRVSVQGAGARLCEVGHCLIILAFQVSERPVEPTMVLVDRNNRFLEYLDGSDRSLETADAPEVQLSGH